VEFTLRYSGALPSATQTKNRVREKHAIRKAFSLQLAELWKLEPVLRHSEAYGLAEGTINGNGVIVEDDAKIATNPGYSIGTLNISLASMHYAVVMNGFRLIPLITRRNQLACRLNIKFLRRGQPGDLVKASGDLDNRLKVLFDALRMPHTVEQLDGDTPAEFSDPLYCVLEDDSLITGFNVDTGRLLTSGTDENEVDLMIDVSVKALVATTTNIGY
jgi:hypothetical protein